MGKSKKWNAPFGMHSILLNGRNGQSIFQNAPLHCMEETNELGNMFSNYIEKIEVGLRTYI